MNFPGLEPVHRFAHEAMGTIFEVVIAGQEREYASQASKAVFREVDRLESLFSRFNPCSEIGQINALQPSRSLQIGVEVYECLQSAEQVRLDTAGAFDVNYRPRLRIHSPESRRRTRPNRRAGNSLYSGLYTNNTKKQPLPLNHPLPRPLPSREREFFPPYDVNNPGYELLSGADGFAIRRPELVGEKDAASLDLDLGGIGKGYALDRAAAVLSDWTVERALVHSGTSTVAAIGSALGPGSNEQGWPMGVGGKWTAAGAPGPVLLWNRALSGSGTEVKGGHILDPRTGGRAQSHLSAWVSHPSAAIADALSTAFMVMEQKEVRAYCARHPEVWALVITSAGKPLSYNPHILSSPSPNRRNMGC
jgi:thiamine biosynthesis lipoprotein